MHPRTAALAALEKSLQETARLERRLRRLSTHRPPVYWELDPVMLHTVTQLRLALQTAREQLLTAPQIDPKN